jgi:hypothetical protein
MRPTSRLQECAAWTWLVSLTMAAWDAIPFIGRYRPRAVVQALDAIAPGKWLYLENPVLCTSCSSAGWQ